ncbi:MAG: YaaL family protein [Lachnospiraceae bacterium]|nr:YaaL family protein [Lachnospiraceae bacterium]
MKRQARELQQIRERLLCEIDDTRRSLETVHSNFRCAIDPDLIDCYIYEMNAINFRYKYLLRQVKEFDLTTSQVEGTMNERTLRRICNERGIETNC